MTKFKIISNSKTAKYIENESEELYIFNIWTLLVFMFCLFALYEVIELLYISLWL